MKKLLILFLFFISSPSFSQDTIYYDENSKETSSLLTAKTYQVLERTADNPDSGFKRTYIVPDQIKVEEFYSSFKNEILEGKKKVWRKDGSLWTEADYKKGELDGFFISYWQDGQLKRKDIYKKGKWKSGKTWDENGNVVPWYPMEVKPEFPGGLRALHNYIKANAKKPNGVNGGKVVVGFVIDVDGSITDVRIEKSSSISLNLTAYNVIVNMPAWKPGQQDGNIVRVKYSIPLNFR